jgi:hypothetical protein
MSRSVIQRASRVRIQDSTFNNTRDQTNYAVGGDVHITHNANPGMHRIKTNSAFVTIRTHASFFIDQSLCSTC